MVVLVRKKPGRSLEEGDRKQDGRWLVEGCSCLEEACLRSCMEPQRGVQEACCGAPGLPALEASGNLGDGKVI